MKEDILVSVLCITYNHENYIRETLEGFLMQKTNFNYEVLIHEDASTDKTAEIIKEYERKFPEIFRVVYEEENQYGKGVEYCHDILAPLARGKYLALCEGDDAWIDDKKLQFQVDYMESHPECSLSTHKAYLQYPAGWWQPRASRAMGYQEEGIIKFSDLFTSWSVATSSFLFRKKDYMPMPEFFRKAPTGDEPLKFYLAGKGTVYYIDRVMSVYNKMSIGSWSADFSSSDCDYKKQVIYCAGYISFFDQLDVYFDFQHHDLMELCVRERIRRLLVHLFFTYDKLEPVMECLDCLKDLCDKKWHSYIDMKKQGFFMLDQDQFRLFLQERVADKKIYIYGAGNIARKTFHQMKACGYDISGLIISDGQTHQEGILGCNVMYFDKFCRENHEQSVVIIATRDDYARAIMDKLNKAGITDFIWICKQIYEVD